MHLNYLTPDWPAPENIRAYTTTRVDGFSKPPYASFNLGLHVHDEPEAVKANRAKLKQDLSLPSEPFWLNQEHSNQVVCIETATSNNADAAFTRKTNTIAAVLTADCLPILICDNDASIVAALHVGWKGLAANIIENTIHAMQRDSAQLMAWFGPAIGPTKFEVGDVVYNTLTASHVEAQCAFESIANKKWLCDIYLLAAQRLLKLGVNKIYGGEHCTYENDKLFYSYRRDGTTTGRMASLIWITE